MATNAVLTRRGARDRRCSRRDGFRDALALRHGTARGAVRQPAAAAASRSCRATCALGVVERTDYAAARSRRSTRTACARAASAFARGGRRGGRDLFMHSPPGPAHERRARELCRELLPGALRDGCRATSCRRCAYYDRASSTTCSTPTSARSSPATSSADRRGSPSCGFGGVLLIMQSNGGVATPAEVSRARRALAPLRARPPAPAAGCGTSRAHGARRLHHVDMGGTSFDAALVKDGAPLHDDRRRCRPLADRAADDRHPHDRRRRRLDRAGRRGRPAARRPAERRRRARARPATAAAARSRRSPTPTSSSATSTRRLPARRLRLDRAARARTRSRSASRGPLGLPRREAAAGIYDVVNVRWRPASATSASAAGSTRATSRSSSRAAPGRSTPRRSPASSRSRCSSCRASPRSSAPPGCSCPTSSTISCGPTRRRSPSSTCRGSRGCCGRWSRRGGPCSSASGSIQPGSRCARRSICATSASGTS